MKDHGRTRALTFLFTMQLFGVLCPDVSHAEEPSIEIAADGTVHFSDLAIPPSELLSSEFRTRNERRKATQGARSSVHPVPVPARNAPKSEWARFDAFMNDAVAQPALDSALDHYPAQFEETRIAGVRVGIISPKDGIPPRNQRRVLLNLHGGGFYLFRGLVLGQVESVPVAGLGKIKVITVDYRQSPNFHYPAASEDVEAVYRELLKQYRPESIGLYGCAAGGFLAGQAVARFQAKGLPRPGAVAFVCGMPPVPPLPWNRAGDSKVWYLGKPPHEAANWYLEGADVHDAQAYPGSSEDVLGRFPSTLLVTGTRDWDLSATVVAHAQLLRLGVDASLYVIEGVPHAQHIFFPETPETRNAYTYIARWFDRHLAP